MYHLGVKLSKSEALWYKDVKRAKARYQLQIKRDYINVIVKLKINRYIGYVWIDSKKNKILLLFYLNKLRLENKIFVPNEIIKKIFNNIDFEANLQIYKICGNINNVLIIHRKKDRFNIFRFRIFQRTQHTHIHII